MTNVIYDFLSMKLLAKTPASFDYTSAHNAVAYPYTFVRKNHVTYLAFFVFSKRGGQVHATFHSHVYGRQWAEQLKSK